MASKGFAIVLFIIRFQLCRTEKYTSAFSELMHNPSTGPLHLRIFFSNSSDTTLDLNMLFETFNRLQLHNSNKFVYSLQNLRYPVPPVLEQIEKVIKLMHHKYILLGHLYLMNKVADFSSLIKDATREIDSSYPRYVLIFTQLYQTYDHRSIQKVLKQSGYTVTFSIVVARLSEVYFLCLVCESKHSNIKSGKVNLSQYLSDHSKMKINLNLAPIKVTKTPPRGKITCAPPFSTQLMEFVPDEQTCVAQTLYKYLNFTWTPHTLPKLYPRILSNYYVTDLFLNISAQEKKLSIEFAFIQQTWAFISVKPGLDVYNEAFTGMLDIGLWISLMGLYIIMRMSVVVSLAIMNSFSGGNIFKIILKLIASFINSGLYRKLKAHSRKWNNVRWHLVTKVVWALTMSTVVSFAYRAELTSFLTKSAENFFPTALKQLTQAGGIIFSFSSGTLIRDPKRVDALIKHSLTLAFEKQELNAKFKIPDYYSKFQSMVKLYSDGSLHLISELFRQMSATDLYNKDAIPDEFSIYDVQNKVEMQKELLNFFVPSKYVSPVVTENLLVMIAPFTVDKSYIFSPVKRGLAVCFESGLYMKWADVHDEATALDSNTLKGIGRLLETSCGNGTQTRDDNVCTGIELKHWHGYLMAKQLGKVTANARSTKALEVHNLKIIWIIFSIAILLVLIVLMMEYGFDLVYVKINTMRVIKISTLG